MTKYKFVRKLAKSLTNSGRTLNGNELARLLNRVGYKTNYGTPFAGARGVYKLISATWHRQGKGKDAEMIAHAYTDQYGNFAWN
ncbi:MAG: hypothetical protein JST90_17395 [Bacteroidetes bacterium]|nr:hypothetical protein [Bacteroidota bacterium]